MSKTIVKSWTFRSNSNPNKTYETLQYSDGDTSCNCRGWTYAKNGTRSCTHTRKVDQGLADREALSVWNSPNSIRVEPLPVRQPQRALPIIDLIEIPKKKAPAKRVKVEAAPHRIVNWRD